MKKYLAVLFTVVLFTPAVFAELPSLDMQGSINEYSNLITNLIKNIDNCKVKYNGIEVSDPKYFDKDYTTEQYISYENEADTDYDIKMPAPEAKTTKGYYELVINVPAGYRVIDYNKSVVMIINNKEVRLKLDYNIKANDNNDDNSILIDYDENGFPVLTRPVTITLKYSPRYFKKLDTWVHYTPIDKPLNVNYNGKDIPLNTKTYAALEFGHKGGTSIYYVLEPNLQNLYNDFKFVRENKGVLVGK